MRSRVGYQLLQGQVQQPSDDLDVAYMVSPESMHYIVSVPYNGIREPKGKAQGLRSQGPSAYHHMRKKRTGDVSYDHRS